MSKQLFTFTEFLQESVQDKAVSLDTLVLWMQSGELTTSQYGTVQTELMRRKTAGKKGQKT